MSMNSNERGPNSRDSIRGEASECFAALGSKIFRRLRREVSMPNSALQSSQTDRFSSPRLMPVRSADNPENSRRQYGSEKLWGIGLSGPVASKHGSLLYQQRRTRIHRKFCVEDETFLKQLRSEDSTADDEASVPNSHSDADSRQQNFLWDEGPGSKSDMFLSLLNIENDEEP